MGKSSSNTTWELIIFILLKKYAHLSVSAAIFCKQFLAYTVHIDWCYHAAFHKHSCSFQHISVLTTYTLIFRQVCTIELSFLKTTSGLHRRPFEGLRLVFSRLSLNKLRIEK